MKRSALTAEKILGFSGKGDNVTLCVGEAFSRGRRREGAWGTLSGGMVSSGESSRHPRTIPPHTKTIIIIIIIIITATITIILTFDSQSPAMYHSTTEPRSGAPFTQARSSACCNTGLKGNIPRPINPHFND